MIHINVKEEREYINVPYASPCSYITGFETIVSFDTQDDYDNFVVESHDNADGSKYLKLGINLYKEPIYLCPAIAHYLTVQTSDNKPDDGLILIGTQYIEFEKMCLKND
jgi:hypothetical protein